MREKLYEILSEAQNFVNEVKDLKGLTDLKVKYLGKKGDLTAIMKEMGKLSSEERPVIGQIANEVRTKITDVIESKIENIRREELKAKLISEKIDVSEPFLQHSLGAYHPISQVQRQIENIFIGMGFKIEYGPEIETVANNFDALNSPIDHPSRSESDTFYFNPELILRTHTSPVQIRTMKNQNPPIKIVAPGRCFRKDEVDATHSPMFHQFEGLVVDKNVNMRQLKGTLDTFVKLMFGADTKTKFRPHFFPFTEPSAEMDVYMNQYDKYGNVIEGQGRWLEILGCGMVHPHVLANCGIDPEIYSGFAFGMGLDRITMLKYEIDDIRALFENDIRFLKQF